MTGDAVPGAGLLRPAAMEPAEYRPDDGNPVSFLADHSLPQWSRPSIGRMTCDPRKQGRWCREWPQWSRPSIGRMTGEQRPAGQARPHAAMEPAEYRPDDQPHGKSTRNRSKPQWSRPSIGRMTTRAAGGLPPSIRRNGAGRVSAG